MNTAEAICVAHGVGAKLIVESASLLLEAENPPPLAVIEALRTHKGEVLELFRDEAERRSIVEWPNAHPVSSDPETCCWCDEPERSGYVLLPFGVSQWVTHGCTAVAKAALAQRGVLPNSQLETER